MLLSSSLSHLPPASPPLGCGPVGGSQFYAVGCLNWRYSRWPIGRVDTCWRNVHSSALPQQTSMATRRATLSAISPLTHSAAKQGSKSLSAYFKLAKTKHWPLVQCRFASHAVMKSKPVIPKPPKQPPKKYDIEWNPQPGGLQGWTDWRMKKNYRNRQICVEWGLEHTLLKAMKNQVILPREIQELAMEDFHAMPIHAAYLTLHERCAISSRGTGVVRNWRISRFFFRHLSDYNKMSGVRRGIW